MAPTNIWIAASDGNVDYVRELISSGAHTPNDKDPNGYTPLHAATSYGHTDLLRYLLNNGGDISIADNDGDTLLHIVEDLKTAQMLVEEFNADWKAKNEEGQTVCITNIMEVYNNHLLTTLVASYKTRR